MMLKKEKLISLELELIKREVEGVSCVYFFKDVNNILNIEEGIIKIESYNVFEAIDYECFCDINDDVIEVSDIPILNALYKNDDELLEDIIPVIISYLKENNLPNKYKDVDDSDFRFLTYNICENITDKGIFKSKIKDFSKMEDKFMAYNYEGYEVYWEYDNGILKLINKYLTKEKEVDVYDKDELDKFILDFNKEWNYIINGKFEWK